MAGNRVPKVREEDWVSVQKAIRRLNAAASGDTNVTYRVVNVNNSVNITNGGQIIGLRWENVANAAARLALTWYSGRCCYQVDEGTFWGATIL